MNPKIKSLLAHLTPLGWIIAFALNSFKKDEITGFYLRQSLGLFLFFLVTRLIPEYYIVVWGFLFLFWVLSFVGAIKQTHEPIPLFGTHFQRWFGKLK
jgi:zinc transporter ZupT